MLWASFVFNSEDALKTTPRFFEWKLKVRQQPVGTLFFEAVLFLSAFCIDGLLALFVVVTIMLQFRKKLLRVFESHLEFYLGPENFVLSKLYLLGVLVVLAAGLLIFPLARRILLEILIPALVLTAAGWLLSLSPNLAFSWERPLAFLGASGLCLLAWLLAYVTIERAPNSLPAVETANELQEQGEIFGVPIKLVLVFIAIKILVIGAMVWAQK